tara:strand:+ start:115 stop:429 length:315 start_codon:yes stop_codon:yes gene_type:complete
LSKKAETKKKVEKKQKKSTSVNLPPENSERVTKLAIEVMEPALRDALRQADGKAPAIEIMSALANAYGGLLVDFLGRKAAVSLMRGHADHVESVEDQPINVEKH